MLRTLKRVGLGTNDLVLVYCSIVRSIVEYASPVWAAIPLYLDELIESVQRKALKIIFGRVDYKEALVLAGLEFLSDRRVGACKRFMATARQMSPLKNIIPSPAAIESHYSIRVQLPRRQHGHTRRINDFVTYKILVYVCKWLIVCDNDLPQQFNCWCKCHQSSTENKPPF